RRSRQPRRENGSRGEKAGHAGGGTAEARRAGSTRETRPRCRSSRAFRRRANSREGAVRTAIIALVVTLLAALAVAQKPESQQPNEIAHGAEKAGHNAAHSESTEGGPHEGPKFLGLPSWIWKLANML